MKKILFGFGLLIATLFFVAASIPSMYQPPVVDASLVGLGTSDEPLGADYDKYIVELTQSSTSAPTATVIHQEIAPDTIIRNSAGVYTLEFDDAALTNNDTYVRFFIGNATAAFSKAYSITDSTAIVKTYDDTTGAVDLGGTGYLEILVAKD